MATPKPRSLTSSLKSCCTRQDSQTYAASDISKRSAPIQRSSSSSAEKGEVTMSKSLNEVSLLIRIILLLSPPSSTSQALSTNYDANTADCPIRHQRRQRHGTCPRLSATGGQIGVPRYFPARSETSCRVVRVYALACFGCHLRDLWGNARLGSCEKARTSHNGNSRKFVESGE